MTGIKRLFGGRRKDVDMTEGSVARHLVTFAIPLLAGNLFQQFYNTVDTWVVGNYVSNEAFSAVGTVSPIIDMLIGAFTGLASGAGVVISQYYGAKRYDQVHKSVHTALVMTFFLCIFFTIVGIGMTPMMLRLMKTPAQVFPQSQTYLNIYFGGITGLLIYNMGAGILRAVGDSRRPFYFLVVSACVNIALDLVFVIAFDMGVAGVAWATIIAQGISALLVLLTLARTDTCVKLYLSALRPDRAILSKIIRVGIPSAFQMAITAFSNVFVQSYINYFGADCMSGWTAMSKIDQLILLPIQSLALASTTFVGQNLGISNVKRAQEGVRKATLMAMGVTACIASVIMVSALPLVGFFNDKPEVVAYGTLFLRCIPPFYLLPCINQIFAGALRGAGKSRVPMVIMLFSFVAFRQMYLFVMANFISNTVVPIALGYPAGWMMSSCLILIYYRRHGLSGGQLVEAREDR